MMDPKQETTGSLNTGEPEFLQVGHLQRSHGVAGEIAMRVVTDFPERLRKGKTVYLGEAHKAYKIASKRWKQALMLIRFEGIENCEQASMLTNLDVFVHTWQVPSLPEGSYYHHELIGLNVFEGAQKLGELSEILVTGANDVYVVRLAEGGELLLPAIPSVILEVNLAAQSMLVSVPEGLRG